MLKGISPLISPELLKVLCEMGHGDEIVLADANFPAESMGQRVVRADGIGAAELLRAILPLFPLDQYDESNFVLMSVVPGDPTVPVIWDEYRATLTAYEPDAKIQTIDRFAYYERAKKAYCIVATGESAQYANILLKKGVIRQHCKCYETQDYTDNSFYTPLLFESRFFIIAVYLFSRIADEKRKFQDDGEEGADYRHHRSGWFLFGGVPARKRL